MSGCVNWNNFSLAIHYWSHLLKHTVSRTRSFASAKRYVLQFNMCASVWICVKCWKWEVLSWRNTAKERQANERKRETAQKQIRARTTNALAHIICYSIYSKQYTMCTSARYVLIVLQWATATSFLSNSILRSKFKKFPFFSIKHPINILNHDKYTLYIWLLWWRRWQQKPRNRLIMPAVIIMGLSGRINA